MNRRRRISMLKLLLVVVACGTLGCSDEATSNAKPDKPSIPAEPPPHRDGTEIAAERKDAVAAVAPTASIVTGKLTDADLARSSWENPFSPRLWSCEGWRINEDSMTCESETLQPASFLRPYRNVVIECRLTRPEESQTVEPTESPLTFELRLLDQSTGHWIGLNVADDNVSLEEFSEDRKPVLQTLRETPRDISGETHEVAVRLTMTPNRILVAINGRLKINAARPTSTMSVECLVQFVADESGVTLSDLRIEGD
jgi:hypothetical protein